MCKNMISLTLSYKARTVWVKEAIAKLIHANTPSHGLLLREFTGFWSKFLLNKYSLSEPAKFFIPDVKDKMNTFLNIFFIQNTRDQHGQYCLSAENLVLCCLYHQVAV